MKTNVQYLIQNALGEGARSSKYDIMIVLKHGSYDGKNIAILAKSANFPSRQHQTIDFRFKGRSIPIRGLSKYSQTWECTFYLTEDHKLKNLFEIWMESLDEKENYVSDNYAKKEREQNSSGYTSEIKIFQQNFNDTDSTAEYTLHNVFPTEMSPVQISAENPGNVLEFSVTFAYSHYTLDVLDSSKGSFIDKMIDKLKNGVTSMVSNAIDGFLDKELEFFDMITGGLNSLEESAEKKFEDLLNGKNDFYDIDWGEKLYNASVAWQNFANNPTSIFSSSSEESNPNSQKTLKSSRKR